MQLCKFSLDSESRVGLVRDGRVCSLDFSKSAGVRTLSDILHADDPAGLAAKLADERASRPLGDVALLPPIDRQEVWAAGVTYQRSQVARREESKDAGSFYDKVYVSDRPEIFFKATPSRVVGPGNNVRLRRDTRWCVPEPELALVVSPRLEIVGYTIGDDVSCRDIEGENPLYLPQAKVFDACCALGPVVTLAAAMPPRDQVRIQLAIRRAGATVFAGSTDLGKMARRFEDLVAWLARDQSFPDGVILLTGTGIVPPDDFSLQPGDQVAMEVDGIGTLVTGVGFGN
jgi:2-dehydro-3-deoxy-D-arabinonate dehydratase